MLLVHWTRFIYDTIGGEWIIICCWMGSFFVCCWYRPHANLKFSSASGRPIRSSVPWTPSLCTTWWPSSLVMSCYSEPCLYITYFKKVLPCPGAFVNTVLSSFFACDLRSSIWEFDLVRLFALWAFLKYNSIPVLISYHTEEPKWLTASITLLSPVMTVSSCEQHKS